MGFNQERGQPRSLRRGRNGRDVTKDRLSRHCLLAIPVGDFTPNFKGDHDVAFGALFLPPLVRGGLTPRNGLVGRHRRGQVADEARFKIDERLGGRTGHGGNRVYAADGTRGPAERQPLFLLISDDTAPVSATKRKGRKENGGCGIGRRLWRLCRKPPFSRNFVLFAFFVAKTTSTFDIPSTDIRHQTFQPFNFSTFQLGKAPDTSAHAIAAFAVFQAPPRQAEISGRVMRESIAEP